MITVAHAAAAMTDVAFAIITGAETRAHAIMVAAAVRIATVGETGAEATARESGINAMAAAVPTARAFVTGAAFAITVTTDIAAETFIVTGAIPIAGVM